MIDMIRTVETFHWSTTNLQLLSSIAPLVRITLELQIVSVMSVPALRRGEAQNTYS